MSLSSDSSAMSSPSTQPVRRASIRDVAREAGVSHTMVSLILNGKTAGSDVTRQKVMEAVQKLDYRPDALYRKAVTARARNDRGEVGKQKTGILAYLLPQWMTAEAAGNEGFYSLMMGGVNAEAAEYDYHVLLCPLSSDPVGIPAVIQDEKVDGVIINMSLPNQWIQVLANSIPCVGMNRYLPDVSMTYVTPNWGDAARKQVQHAWELGHRNIAFCEYNDGVPHMISPYDFFHSSLRTIGGHLVHPHLSRYRDKPATGEEMQVDLADFVSEWMECQPRPTMILTNDGLGVRLINEFHKRGVRIPQDVSIVSRYGHEMATKSDPALTTYNYPNWEIARTATRLLIEGIRSGNPHPSHVMMQGEMIIRDSSRPLTPEEAEASMQT